MTTHRPHIRHAFADRRSVAGVVCALAWLVMAVLPLGHALEHDPHDHVHTERGTVATDDDADEHAHEHGHTLDGHALARIPVLDIDAILTEASARLARGEPVPGFAADGVRVAASHGAGDHTDPDGAEHDHADDHSHGVAGLTWGTPSAHGVDHARGPAHADLAIVRAAAAVMVLAVAPDPGPAPSPLWRAERVADDLHPGVRLARGPPTARG